MITSYPPTSRLRSDMKERIPSASAGKPPHELAVQAFNRLIARPRAISVTLISVAVNTGAPTSDCPSYLEMTATLRRLGVSGR
jgi:hypothetical protein